jgi:hypothetical protein
MAPKGKKSTEAESKAGQGNLARWLEEHPQRGNLRHGAWSKHVRKRYSDLRTTEGQRLENVIRGLIADLGGNSEISSAQRLLLDNVRSKLIVLFQISSHVDKQESLINEKGELLPCLGKNYTSYAESLRRDLEALFSIRRKTAPLSYNEAMKKLNEGNRK